MKRKLRMKVGHYQSKLFFLSSSPSILNLIFPHISVFRVILLSTFAIAWLGMRKLSQNHLNQDGTVSATSRTSLTRRVVRCPVLKVQKIQRHCPIRLMTCIPQRQVKLVIIVLQQRGKMNRIHLEMILMAQMTLRMAQTILSMEVVILWRVQ